jgi:hypothetical protein
MSVTGATTRNDYSSGNNQTVFVYTFQILLATDIKVLQNGSVLAINDDYSVSNVGVAGGGSVTLVTGASAGDIVSVFLSMPIDRTTQYQNAGDFLASDVNGDFDKGYIAMNQLQTDIARSLHLQDQDPTVNTEIPLKAERASKYLKFNSSGEPTAVSGTLYSSADLVSIKSFGAVGDGSTDDSVAIAAALNSGDNLFVPEGTYYIPNWTTVTRSTPLKMWGTGTIKGLNKVDTFVKCLNDVSVTGVGFEQFAFVFKNEKTDPVTVDKFYLNNVTVKNCGGGITLEAAVNTFTVTDCDFDTTIADKPIRVGYNTYTFQDIWKNFTITGNTFRDISTTGATDCNVILIYGKQATISGNTFENVSAVGSEQLFNGTGSQTAFTLAESGLNAGQTTVYISGVEQVNTDEDVLWSISGTTLTFTTPPASGTNNVKIVYFGESAAIYTKARFVTITGNTISGVTSGNVNQVYGINVKGRGRGDTERTNGFNVTVTGNTLVGVNGIGSGIRIQNDFVNVTGNNIERFRFGINGNTAGHNNSNITGNNIFHCQQYGIHVIQSGVNYVIQGNNIQGQLVSSVYEPLIGIKVRAFSDTSNYSIANNVISTCKKGIKLDQSEAGFQINNVQIVNNSLNDVDDNGVEFAACNTILVKDNTYDGAVANNYIRAVNPNQNVRIVDSRTKTLDTASSTAIQTWNSSIVDQVIKLTASATGRRTDDGEFAAYKIVALYKVVGGTLAQVGSTVTEYAIESDTGWTGITFDTNSNDIFLDVQAESGSINWTYQTEYVSSTDATI